ncbi:hypothetical protein DMA11_11885 [Marinilabiliaceae bacterium JC017]|nr:hypothetical protein DMA11_11885 [Marinilabiliaceae bacterium JC017]
MRKRSKIISLLLCLMTVLGCSRKSDYAVPDGDTIIIDEGSGIGNVTLTPDKNYLFTGKVYVNPGQTLTIKAGTVLRFKTGQGENASALIVAKGAKIIADGTKEAPIILTVENDDLEGSIPALNRGLWGGLIILGAAPVNTPSGNGHIEGLPVEEPRGIYGGNFPGDNSGVLRYVSIRHGGTNIGENNEINGLTLGGVGNGTTLEHVEVISNLDDGFEFFGGTVNASYLVSAFCGDDAFDFDLGYKGNLQFLVGIQHSTLGELLAEISDRDNSPVTQPLIANATFIGEKAIGSQHMVQYKTSGAGKFLNSIFLEQKNGIELEYKNTQLDCFQQFKNGRIALNNNLFFNVAGNSSRSVFSVFSDLGSDISEQDELFKDHFNEGQNKIYDPGIKIGETIDLIPSNPVSENMAAYPNDWFEKTDYKGAMLNENWLLDWTLLHQSGYIE